MSLCAAARHAPTSEQIIISFRTGAIAACILSLVLAAASQAGAREASFAEAAADAVAKLGKDAATVAHAPDLSAEDRSLRFRALFRDRFNIAALAQQSLGYHWAAATAEQRREFSALFETLLVTSYAARFASYAPGEFRVTGKRDEGPGDALIYSQALGRTDPGFHRIDWRIRLSPDGQPRIVDVMLTGVSQMMTAQQDFDLSIRTAGDGVAGLIVRLRQQVAVPVSEPE